MWDAHREHPVKALRRPQRREQSGPPAPIMTNPGHPLYPQHIEKGQQVRGQLLLLISGIRGLGPAMATQIRHDHSKTLDQPWYDATPRPPVLRPAVHQHDRWRVLGSR